MAWTREPSGRSCGGRAEDPGVVFDRPLLDGCVGHGLADTLSDPVGELVLEGAWRSGGLQNAGQRLGIEGVIPGRVGDGGDNVVGGIRPL